MMTGHVISRYKSAEAVDPVKNPYTPNAGSRPPELAGRDEQLEQFRVLVARLKRGQTDQSIIAKGLRGVGKTVLLNAFEDMAESEGFLTYYHELTRRAILVEELARDAERALAMLKLSDHVMQKVRDGLGHLKTIRLMGPGGLRPRGRPQEGERGDADGRSDGPLPRARTRRAKEREGRGLLPRRGPVRRRGSVPGADKRPAPSEPEALADFGRGGRAASDPSSDRGGPLVRGALVRLSDYRQPARRRRGHRPCGTGPGYRRSSTPETP